MVRGKAVDAPGKGAGGQAVAQGVLPREFGVEEDGLPFDLDHELMRHRALARAGQPVAVHVARGDEEVPSPVEERDDVVAVEIVGFGEGDTEVTGPIDLREFRAHPGVDGVASASSSR